MRFRSPNCWRTKPKLARCGPGSLAVLTHNKSQKSLYPVLDNTSPLAKNCETESQLLSLKTHS